MDLRGASLVIRPFSGFLGPEVAVTDDAAGTVLVAPIAPMLAEVGLTLVVSAVLAIVLRVWISVDLVQALNGASD